jgi:hypothetical protein
MRFRFVSCLKLFKTIRFRDHAWSFHRQFFWSFNLIFDEWRMFILDYRVTYVCFRSVERGLWWDVFKLDETFHQTHCEQLIKLDEWKRHLIKSDESDSSNLTKEASSHQVEQTRHLIKFFEKRDSSSTFWWAIFCNDIDVKNLILQKIIFCAKIYVCVRLLW